MEIQVIRSPDRKKTIQAKMVGETLHVNLPFGMHREEERKIIEKMKKKIEKKKQKKQINYDDYLITKFNEFNIKYFQGKLKVEMGSGLCYNARNESLKEWRKWRKVRGMSHLFDFTT